MIFLKKVVPDNAIRNALKRDMATFIILSLLANFIVVKYGDTDPSKVRFE